jgi:hypothetical protein
MQTQVKLPTWNSKETKKNKYVLDGKDYWRVTSVLSAINKPALIGWKANITLDKARRSLQANVGKQVTIDDNFIEEIIDGARAEPDYVLGTARDFGSDAHYALEQYISQGEVPSNASMYRVIGAFNQWVKDNGIEMLPHAEVTVAHPHGFAGTIDALGMKKDALELIVIDWKTSGGIYPEAMLQVSAYAAALQECTGVKVSEAWIVRFPREEPEPGELPFDWVRLDQTNLANNFGLFCSAQRIYEHVLLTAGQRGLHDGTGTIKK